MEENNATEADQLEEDIELLNALYEKGLPTVLPRTGETITDFEYDKFWKRLEKLRPDSEVLLALTGTSVGMVPGAKKVKLDPPMASISKAIGKLEDRERELHKWLIDCLSDIVQSKSVVVSTNHYGPGVANGQLLFNKYSKSALSKATYLDGSPVFVMSFKRDGVATSIQYENGILKSAAIRPRDGINALDVIEHIKFVHGVPDKLTVPCTLSIRGELECLISEFQKVNDEAEAKGQRTYANPRNSTAGAMNPLGDPKSVHQRRVSFVAHSIEGIDAPPYTTAMERAKWCNQKLMVLFVRVEPLDELRLAMMEQVAKTLDYETDGIVIEVNNLLDGEAMGRHGGSPNGNPKWKLAWKFTEQTAVVTVSNLIWETGRTGRCVPVAIFPTARLAGTNVKRCTLHNLGFVQRFKVGIDAQIEIEKAGKIIPKAIRGVKPAHQVKWPTHCPSCGDKLAIREGSTKDDAGNKIKTFDLICENADCPAQNLNTLVHYLSSIGVKGLAESHVGAAVKAGLVKTYADYYKLKPTEWMKAGLSEREAVLACARIHMIEQPDKIKDTTRLMAITEKAADSKKSIPLHQLIAALGIPGAAKGTGRDLAAHFRNLDTVRNASVFDLQNTPNVGQTTAELIHKWMNDHVHEIDDLMQYVNADGPKLGKFSGKTFVFTGSPLEQTKEYWMKLVEEQGGRISTSVSKKTDYVIVGADAGQKKDKAEELKSQGASITIVDDLNDLKSMLGITATQDDRFF